MTPVRLKVARATAEAGCRPGWYADLVGVGDDLLEQVGPFKSRQAAEVAAGALAFAEGMVILHLVPGIRERTQVEPGSCR